MPTKFMIGTDRTHQGMRSDATSGYFGYRYRTGGQPHGSSRCCGGTVDHPFSDKNLIVPHWYTIQSGKNMITPERNVSDWTLKRDCSTLIGVPDLFSRLGPVLASAIPGRPTHPRVCELKPWVRRTITL